MPKELTQHTAAQPFLPPRTKLRLMFGALVFFGFFSLAFAAQAADNAQYISQTPPPSTMTPGQLALASITMKNTGDTTWYQTCASLGSVCDRLYPPSTIWGISSVQMPVASVAPGAQVTFWFYITAPSQPGTYDFGGWAMGKIQNGPLVFGVTPFGDVTPSFSVNVVPPCTNNGAFVTQTPPPTTMAAGQTANVSVTMNNTGTCTWTSGGYRLGSQNPGGNTTWGSNLNFVALPVSSVAPGSQVTFNFTITAPTTAGTYNFQWQMGQVVGTSFQTFGDLTPNVAVTVAADNAALNWITQPPSTMYAGQSTTISINAVNSGGTTWTSDSYSLNGTFTYLISASGPQGSGTVGSQQLPVSSIAPNGNTTFTFTFTAPDPSKFSQKAYNDVYTFQWQMYHNGNFGNQVSISITIKPSTAPPVISNIASSNITSSEATITWTTDKPATSEVSYGLTTAYNFATTDSTLVTSHSVKLTGLLSYSTYHFQVTSRDANGNATISGDNTFATAPANVSSWGWSETIGWVSFSSQNENAPTSYGVSIGSNGLISGFAWSENIGWVSFNPTDVANCPTTPCTASVNTSTGQVSGWARALGYQDPQAGGWDGWIHLRGTAQDNSTYGLVIYGCNWDGWAWGGTVVGWIHFKGQNYGVTGSGDACNNVSPPSPPTADIKANNSDGPIVIPTGTSATISWTSANATSCSVSPTNWSGTSGSQPTGNLSAGQTYTLTCNGNGGSATDSVTVNIALPPTADIKASGSDGPLTINYPNSTDLSWSSTNATSCTASGGWSGTKATSSSESLGIVTSSSTQSTATIAYTISCSGAGGLAGDSVRVSYPPLPTADIKANNSDGPITVGLNGQAVLSWTSTNATSCQASGGWSGSQPVSGQQNTGQINASQIYTLTCTGLGGQASDSVTVNVKKAPPTFIEIPPD